MNQSLGRFLILFVLIILLVGLAGRALLAYYGLTVTSWWRNPLRNDEVGGKALSMHLIGWAYDVVPVNQYIQDVLKVWPFKIVVESSHIHMQIL